MTALEWLDAVRADLDAATPGPWTVEYNTYGFSIYSPIDCETYNPIGRIYGGSPYGEANATLIASAPDRLDRMERALRGVMDMHRRSGCREPWDTCPTVEAIEEVLGDE